MKFYSSKFPIRTIGHHGSEKEEFFPVGTVFKVSALSGAMIELKSIKKEHGDFITPVTPELLSFAFTETDSI